jgi:phospholipid/cholesterol/gamma-HCH transport system permease protein
VLFYPLELIGGVTEMAINVVVSAIVRPVGYWRATRDEMYGVLKVSWFPIVSAVFTFGFLVSLLAAGFVGRLGALSRWGPLLFQIQIREFTPWINSMVVAGVVGAAICADLGARKIREELDALEVLGVDPVRELVLPKVVSVTILTPALAIVATLMGMLCNLVGSAAFGQPVNDYLNQVYGNFSVVDLVGMIIKMIVIGFIIGVVCAYKGMAASGGAIGVGRAVNQAVITSFVLVFVIDGLFNAVMLGLFPELQIQR